MEDRLKILAFSDIHGDERLLEKLGQQAEDENVDLVMICGDYSGPGEEIPRGLIKNFKSRGKPVLLLRGNHESEPTAEFLAELYDIKHLEGQGFRYKHVGIFGSSAANLGMFHISENQIARNLEAGHDQIKYLSKKIMATHVHPNGSMVAENFFQGSDAVREAITKFKPDILICGHIHEAEGVEEIIEGTRVINVSKNGRILKL
jgi:uncharacterized protein